MDPKSYVQRSWVGRKTATSPWQRWKTPKLDYSENERFRSHAGDFQNFNWMPPSKNVIER